MGSTTSKLVGGLLTLIVGLVLVPVLTSAMTPITQENRFLCTGDITGGSPYSAYCTLNSGETFARAPANGGKLTIGRPVAFADNTESRPALTGAGLGFTVAASATKAAVNAAQSGTVAWAPSGGTATASLLDILPLVFAVGLVSLAVWQFVSVARSRSLG